MALRIPRQMNILQLHLVTSLSMKLLYTLFILPAIFIISCKTAKPVVQNINAREEKYPAATAYTGNSFILAIVLKASRKPGDSTITFEIASITKVPGKLKPGQNDNSGNDYLVSFASADNVAVDNYSIRDPLNTWIESSDESGKLETTRVKKDEEHISIRTNYKPEMKKLIIRKNNIGDTHPTIIPLNIQ